MKLSIIIPVYNVENYIEECVKSIRSQSLTDDEYEIILVNDGSTDNSLSICELLVNSYSNIRLFNQPNKGQSTARNVGLKHAIGSYIFFIDSDDYLKPQYLKNLLNIIESQSLDFLGFECERTKNRFDINLKPEKLIFLTKGDGVQLLEKHNYNNGPWWYIFKKSILDGLLFEEDRLCEDGIFTAQLIQKVQKGRVYNNKVYCYFENPDSTVKTVNKERNEKINRDMFYAANRFKAIIDLLPNKDENNKAFLRLKERQESYTFFALVRFLKRKENYSSLKHVLVELEKGPYPAYPIYYFKGYNNCNLP
ncbi:glycosyltransferase family 2 protein [Empedobacter falsenii]|uniref:glycosyltransferase family 2 protein n=1 Tax=Empedobacter falsenii TaxID=343874 RepID=UPI001C58164B|nr:glycosyltransferase family 2 protein [Empedobacter falsenii]MBW1619750.1 glycosyltransferase [Empedobacter falsenii]